MQDLASFTSHHLAYKVVYLSAESFMTREAINVSFADCLDVAANEKTLISSLLQLCLRAPKALSILLLFKKSGNSYCSLLVLLSWALQVCLVEELGWVCICFRGSLLSRVLGSCWCRGVRLQQGRGLSVRARLHQPHLHYPDRAQQTLVLLLCWNSNSWGWILSCPAEGTEQCFGVCVCDEEHRLSIFIRSHFSDRKLR